MPIAPAQSGPPAHERTLEEFVGEDPEVSQEYGGWSEESFILHRAPYLKDYEIKTRDFYCHEPRKYWTPEGPRDQFHCYSVAVPKDRPAYALLLADMIDAETGKKVISEDMVGEFYAAPFRTNILGIFESHRGKGVGPHFVAAAIEATGHVEPSGAYSPAGLRTRKRAYKILVFNAVERGEAVPERVLLEYLKD